MFTAVTSVTTVHGDSLQQSSRKIRSHVIFVYCFSNRHLKSYHLQQASLTF